MQINIPSELEEFVRSRVAASGFPNVDEYVLGLILREGDDPPFEEQLTDDEMAASLEMLDRGMEDVRAGRTMSVKESLQQTTQALGLTIRR